jgi:pimeloyl-ACP methyl ester carboxylesterase
MAMKKLWYIYIALFMIGLLLVVSCSERENPADFPKINERGFKNDGVYLYKRAYNVIEDHAGWEFFNFTPEKNFFTKIYTPPGWFEQGPPFPILYLLTDFQGDENYYFARMVQHIADSLIYEGEIKQLYIATVDVSTPYGGSWFVDNDFFGWFETMITSEWINFIENQLAGHLNVIRKRESRAIGGFGMGGYGAIKLAAKHPELYGSVSASNPAGKFEGDGDLNGIDVLIDNVFEEQGWHIPASLSEFRDLDTLHMRESKPYTMLFLSMAQAFSPHPEEGQPGFDDSTTFLPFYGVDMPFDYNANLYQAVWDKWIANDLDVILAEYGGNYDSIPLYIEYSDTNQFMFNEQAQSIMNTFDELGIDYTSATYSGYSGYPALDGRFVYDRLVEILKFHSRHLDDEP